MAAIIKRSHPVNKQKPPIGVTIAILKPVSVRKKIVPEKRTVPRVNKVPDQSSKEL